MRTSKPIELPRWAWMILNLSLVVIAAGITAAQ